VVVGEISSIWNALGMPPDVVVWSVLELSIVVDCAVDTFGNIDLAGLIEDDVAGYMQGA
jgi:hypothetical protein